MKIIIREFGDRCWFTLVYYIVTSKWIVFNLRLQAKLASFERILPEVHGTQPVNYWCSFAVYITVITQVQ